MTSNEIELKPGWLARQAAEVKEQVKDWPPEIKALGSINQALNLKRAMMEMDK